MSVRLRLTQDSDAATCALTSPSQSLAGVSLPWSMPPDDSEPSDGEGRGWRLALRLPPENSLCSALPFCAEDPVGAVQVGLHSAEGRDAKPPSQGPAAPPGESLSLADSESSVSPRLTPSRTAAPAPGPLMATCLCAPWPGLHRPARWTVPTGQCSGPHSDTPY